jgi:hypothetical protein
MAEMDTMIQEDSTSTNTDRDNLDRLLKIFNGGTGVNLGVIFVLTLQNLLYNTCTCLLFIMVI